MADAPDPVDNPADSRLALARALRRLVDAARRGKEVIPQAAVALSGALTNHMREGGDAAFFFFHGSGVYIDSELLRAPPELYEGLLEIGDLLERVDRNEFVFASSLSDADAEALARWFASLMDEPESVEPTGPPTSRIVVRSVDPAAYAGVVDPRSSDRPVHDRVASFYSGTLSHLEQYARSSKPWRNHLAELRRIARGLISLTGRARAPMLATATGSPGEEEAHSTALDTAILGLLMARRLTSRVPTLETISTASMILGLDSSPGNRPVETALELLGRSPEGPHGIQRAISVYETKRDAEGQLETESIVSTLVRVAHLWVSLSREPESTPDTVVEELHRRVETPTEEAVLHLLVDTLGLFTEGMPVELASGWQGVVVRAGDHVTSFQRPVIRMGRKPDGERVPPFEIDLGDDGQFDSYGSVVRRIRIDEDPHLEQIRRSVAGADSTARPLSPSNT